MGNLLLNNDFFESLGSSVLPMGEAETLPPECYTDAGFYEFEKEALFNHEWLCTGRESWVSEPGDYYTTLIADEPIIVARTLKGELKAMSAVCQHRAMLVAEGHGNRRGFLCPYHHWSYSLDGGLTNAPAMEKTCDFDKSKFGLASFRVEVWNGFVFVNIDADAPPLSPRLEAVADALANYDLANTEGEKPKPPPESESVPPPESVRWPAAAQGAGRRECRA